MKKSVVSLLLHALVTAIILASTTGCTSKYRIQGTVGGIDRPGAHKVTEVVGLASKEEIISLDNLHQPLLSAGISPAELRNGSVIAGRIYCCGGEGTVETVNRAFVYVPPSIEVGVNDVLEYVEGHGPEADGLSQLNVAVKVRYRDGDKEGKCTWEPNNPKLWMRVLKCPWMEDEGWTRAGGLSPGWFKPSTK